MTAAGWTSLSLRRTRILAAGGLLVLPACVTPEPARPAALPNPPRLATLAAPSIVPASHLETAEAPTGSPASSAKAAAALPPAPSVEPADKPLPINLATALTLANVRPIDVMAATQRIRVSAARLEQARVLWIPSLTVGMDYSRHTGVSANEAGGLSTSTDNGLMFGVGSGLQNAAIVNIDEAIFALVVARQDVRARNADLQAAQNDTLVAVTNAYFTVQNARGELAGAMEVARRTEDLVQRARKLAQGGLVPDLEVTRAEAALVLRRYAEEMARERWRVSGAELVRLLRLNPSARIDPIEPPTLRIDLISPAATVDELIPVALRSRPELESRQAEVQMTLAMLRKEKLRPLIPSLVLSGYSTPDPVALGAGVYAAGPGDSIRNGGFRSDINVELLWQFDNLGLGNRARTHQREAESRLALIELFRLQDWVAADVSTTHSRAVEAGRRLVLSEAEVRLAVESADKNLAAIEQTRQVGGVNQLLVRPLEVVASLQALAQAYSDYYTAMSDYNRAQFQLYRALGYPAQYLADPTAQALPGCNLPAPTPSMPPPQP